MENSSSADHYLRQTRDTYIWTKLLNTPFWALYTLLPIFLYRDLHATEWQIVCFVALQPIVSLLSFYWSSLIKRRSDRLISNIIWASVLGHLPFLISPWIDNPWYFVLGAGVYTLFSRGANPAWMEILKLNIPKESREKVFSFAQAVYHLGGAFLPLGLGWILTDYDQSWRWLFPITAFVSLLAIIIQARLPIKKSDITGVPVSFSFSKQVRKPWVDAWNLVRERPDFAVFQMAFMLGGGALMLMQPALPQFFTDVLNLSYKELTVAKTFCKGIGYTLTLPFWTRLMSKIDIFRFSGLVTLVMALFPLGLLAAQYNVMWLYMAYLMYGVMQAGSDLSWNLSGPIFSRHEDSSTYSGVNVVSVGLRGCVAPPLGGILCSAFAATPVLLLGSALCLMATWQMSRTKKYVETQVS